MTTNPFSSVREQWAALTAEQRRQAFLVRDNVTGQCQPRLFSWDEAQAAATALDTVIRADEVL